MGGLGRAEIAVAAATALYTAGFTAWFVARGNFEFLIYVVTMVGLIALVAATRKSAGMPPMMLAGLSFWGLLHMAGGGIDVGDGRLYGHVVLPLGGSGELNFLKYDQIVHAYGFGVTAWVLRHLLQRHYPVMRGTWALATYPVLASMGLGSLNEMIEFASTLAAEETGVGGYVNNALDLVFNATGAVFAVALCTAADRLRS